MNKRTSIAEYEGVHIYTEGSKADTGNGAGVVNMIRTLDLAGLTAL